MELTSVSVSVVLSIIGLLVTYFGFIQRICDRIAKLEGRDAIYWKAFENKLADMLKSPTHLSKDVLLDKFKDETLSLAETETLRTMLTEEWNNQGKSLALAMLISRLETTITLAAQVTGERRKGLPDRRRVVC